MMCKAWLILLITLIFCINVQSQGRTANWVFGDSLIVQFTPSGPVLSGERSAMSSFEAAASISDTLSNLLFYSNNVAIWNKNHEPLLNSEGINSVSVSYVSSKTNGCLFLPVAGDSTDAKFWVFITDETDHKLRYSLIDKTLDAGLGGIVNDQKNLVLWDTPIGEQVTAVRHGNGRDWWIVIRKGYPNSSQLVSIHLSPSGILETREFEAGIKAKYQGELTSSPIGASLAFAGEGQTGKAILAIYNFSRCDGEIHLRELIQFDSLNQGLYGVAFSKLGNNLYITNPSFGKDILYQVHMTMDTFYLNKIFEFYYPGTSTTGNMTGQLELGPDGKIYVSRRLITGLAGISSYAEYLGVIQYPDEIGAACQFDTFGFYLEGYVNNNTYSLPNFANYDLGPLVGGPCDTLSPQDTTQTSIQPVFPLQGEWSITPSLSSGWYQLNSKKKGWLVVYDLYGREVLKQWHEELTNFDLTTQPAGIYLVYLKAADGTQTRPRKIVRQ